MIRYLRKVGIALALLLGTAPGALAQEPGQKGPRKIYTRTTVFRLPVQLDERDRAELKELKLFVKTLPGDWVCAETAAPAQNAFSFRAPQDGEYWFAFATVDKAGQMSPASLGQEPPGLIVVVDTVAPDVEVRPLPASSQLYLQCKIHDANPDYRSIKVEYELDAKMGLAWTALEPVADTPGVFQVPDKSVLNGKVRVHAADKAGNLLDRVIELGAVKPSSPGPMIAAASPANPPSSALTTAGTPPNPETKPPSPLATPTASEKPVAEKTPSALPTDLVGAPVATPMDVVPASTSPVPETAPAFPPAAPPRDVPIVNALRCKIDFSVEQSAGEVAKVEIWTTVDGGKTWQLSGECRDGKSPANVEFPRDGVYGYSFVVKAGAGPMPTAPTAGDMPDAWIEVDTQKPVLELLAATPGTGADAGLLQINWVAQDKNFGQEPIALMYASQPIGPWYPMAEKLPNSGSYRWPIAKTAGSRAYIRVQAIDRAGNVAVCDSPTPVLLDGSRPKVKVLSVAPAGKE